MKLITLDQNFQSVDVVDTFISFIWTDRFNECGDFELYIPASARAFEIFHQDYYLWADFSDRLMIIEDIELSTDAEDGDKLTITGRSLESILERRIIWGQKVLMGNLQNAIRSLLNESIINPTITNRKINNFVFEASTDTQITSLTIDAEYTGDNLYEVIQDLCETNKIGFKMLLNSSNQFVFSLYVGTNRAYDQNENDYVIFSTKFENLYNTSYMQSKKTLKNAVLVGGEGQGADQKFLSYQPGAESGLARREMYTNASDVSSTYQDSEGESHDIPAAQYNELLRQRAKETLEENKETKTFEGEIEATQLFKYGEDFFLGDALQIVNEYGIESKTKVTEMIYSFDEKGYSMYPTFTIIEEEANS